MLYEGKVVDGNDPDGWHPDAAPDDDDACGSIARQCDLAAARARLGEARAITELKRSEEARAQLETTVKSLEGDLERERALRSAIAASKDGRIDELEESYLRCAIACGVVYEAEGMATRAGPIDAVEAHIARLAKQRGSDLEQIAKLEDERTHAVKMRRRIEELESQLAAIDAIVYCSPEDAKRRTVSAADLVGDMGVDLKIAMDRIESWISWAAKLAGLTRDAASARGVQVVIEEKLAAAIEREDAWSTWGYGLMSCKPSGVDAAWVMRSIESGIDSAHQAIRELRNERDAAVAAVAAAKPVLTDVERACVEGWRSSRAAGLPLVAIIDRLCPPPKAPPSDEEVLEMLEDSRACVDAVRRAAFVAEAIDALRARGGK